MQVADFTATLDIDNLPEEVIRYAKKCVLDLIGVALMGYNTDAGRGIANFVASLGERSEATIIGAGVKASCVGAPLANGTFAKIPEMEDGHRQLGMFHLGSPIIPAAVAVAEREGSSGEELLTSVVLGYEIATRVGRAMRVAYNLPSRSDKLRYSNATVSVGVIGAATAAAKILGLGAEGIVSSWALAAAQMPMRIIHTSSRILARALNHGLAASIGVRGALLAKDTSFRGTGTILEDFCSSISDDVDINQLTDVLGERFDILGTYFKPFACCRYLQPSVTAALELRQKYDINLDDIQEVRVTGDHEAARRVHYDIDVDKIGFNEAYELAKFSVPYVVALALMRQQVTVDDFDEKSLRDPNVHALMRRIKVSGSDELYQYPEKHPAIVEIRMRNGKVYTHRTDYSKGEPEMPMSDEVLQSKFLNLASRVLSVKNAEKALSIINVLEEIPDVRTLTALL